jgi:hypothetical protein
VPLTLAFQMKKTCFFGSNSPFATWGPSYISLVSVVQCTRDPASSRHSLVRRWSSSGSGFGSWARDKAWPFPYSHVLIQVQNKHQPSAKAPLSEIALLEWAAVSLAQLPKPDRLFLVCVISWGSYRRLSLVSGSCGLSCVAGRIEDRALLVLYLGSKDV